MYKYFWLLCIGAFFSFKPCAAQENGGKDDADKKVSGIDYSYYRKGSQKYVESDDEKPYANVIKIGITRWIDGVIPIYYERRVARFVSLQFGLGLTTRDFVYDAIQSLAYDFSGNPPADYNNAAFYSAAGRKSSVGVYAAFQPKFYPTKHHAPGGFFVSPMVEFKRYDYKAEYADIVSTNYDEPIFQSNFMWEYRNCVDFTVNVGQQWLARTGVSLEIMGGVGFQRVWEYRRFINAFANNNGGYSAYSNSTSFSTYYRPEFNIDFNIGGFF